ncbi:uncharacterized protein LOC110057034 [Orbicella faveolata]|uniref:uncharacterized protein LOC110057034 n=1 Tax=Orbicella faveolata TaxID=48498 RepID=UPI0009E58C68|nr:uncharacterized protein LOC110057034 [Orbicella faveolata]
MVCGSVEDRCIIVYSRDENLEQFKMNCSHRDTCKEAVESCHEDMKTKKLECCDVTCCDSDFCNKPKYSDGKFCQRKPDLVAIIYGGAEVIRGQNENITMNASLSYDPVVGLGNHSGMNFTWHYGEIKGNYFGLQRAASDSFTGVNQSTIRYSGSDSGLEVTFNTASMSINKTYLVNLVLTKDYRSSSVYQIIHLVKGDPPEISQRCYACLGSEENCSEDKISTDSGKQMVCGSVEDRCIIVYSRDENLEQFKMNCSHRDTCKEAVESCHEDMKTKKLECCDVTCCDSDFCNKPKYSDGKFCQRKPDLVAIIYGGAEVIRGQNENITMNASLSYDPVVGLGNHSGMNFTWHYGEIKGNYFGLQRAASDSFTGVNQSTIRYSGSDSGLEVTFNTASMSINKTYLVNLVLTKDYRSSSVYQIIHLVKGDPPEISQR